jgi:hypothetical protein
VKSGGISRYDSQGPGPIGIKRNTDNYRGSRSLQIAAVRNMRVDGGLSGGKVDFVIRLMKGD